MMELEFGGAVECGDPPCRVPPHSLSETNQFCLSHVCRSNLALARLALGLQLVVFDSNTFLHFTEFVWCIGTYEILVLLVARSLEHRNVFVSKTIS